MTAPPLTHHEIIGLAEPFSRRGRQVDLAASDRGKRHIAFKPVARGGEGDTTPPCRETLLLECLDSGNFRLTRTLADDNGQRATLRAFGADAGKLLDVVEAVPVSRQLRYQPGCAMAVSLRLEPITGTVITQAELRLQGLGVTVEVPSVKGVAADITLRGPVSDDPDLPQDLLAVQGWDWTRLARNSLGWHSRVRLRGHEPWRSERAQARLDELAAHLARTLAEPPARFHERHRGARFGVVLRRSIPVLTLGLLALGLWVLSRMAVGTDTGAWILLLHVPTAMLAISFSLQEMAQFEIPPWPRPLRAAGWKSS